MPIEHEQQQQQQFAKAFCSSHAKQLAMPEIPATATTVIIITTKTAALCALQPVKCPANNIKLHLLLRFEIAMIYSSLLLNELVSYSINSKASLS